MRPVSYRPGERIWVSVLLVKETQWLLQVPWDAPTCFGQYTVLPSMPDAINPPNASDRSSVSSVELSTPMVTVAGSRANCVAALR